MKNIHYLLIGVAATLGCASCNNEWEDEQFDQMVSIKAQPDGDGVTPLYVRYTPDGVKRYELPIILSGSTMNTRDREVRIAVDPDTLESLNTERYGDRTELYYQQLSTEYYNAPETVTIPAGDCTTVLPIDFTLGGTDGNDPLDLSDKWILPLTVVDDESYDYISNPRKYYRKALMHITPFNDYSGTYSSTLYNIYLENDKNNAFTNESVKAYVHDDNTIFIYMGLRDMEYTDRKNYKCYIRFSDELAGIDTMKKKVEIWSDNDDPVNGNAFKIGNNTSYYTMDSEFDVNKPYLKKVYINVYLNYTFEDYTTSPGQRLHYEVDGTLSMQRNLNTLIPDEDQQIQW